MEREDKRGGGGSQKLKVESSRFKGSKKVREELNTESAEIEHRVHRQEKKEKTRA